MFYCNFNKIKFKDPLPQISYNLMLKNIYVGIIVMFRVTFILSGQIILK